MEWAIRKLESTVPSFFDKGFEAWIGYPQACKLQFSRDANGHLVVYIGNVILYAMYLCTGSVQHYIFKSADCLAKFDKNI